MLLDLEHQLLKQLREVRVENAGIIVGLSGGLDSVCLLVSLAHLQQILSLKLKAVHVHHGHGPDLEQNLYRDSLPDFCLQLCQKLGIELVVENVQVAFGDPVAELGEAEFRELRYGAIKQKLDAEFSYFATAHHADDLLETRMHRLIRGVGSQGLEAMRVLKAPHMRPFIGFSRDSLKEYAIQKKLLWKEDPSNTNPKYFRNWLREVWLKQLEQYQPGALKSLARSLDNICSEAKQESPEGLFGSESGVLSLQREVWLQLSVKEQYRALAEYLLKLGIKDYSQSHIKEICKQLDIERKAHTFIVAGCEWTANARQIVAKKQD